MIFISDLFQLTHCWFNKMAQWCHFWIMMNITEQNERDVNGSSLNNDDKMWRHFRNSDGTQLLWNYPAMWFYLYKLLMMKWSYMVSSLNSCPKSSIDWTVTLVFFPRPYMFCVGFFFYVFFFVRNVSHTLWIFSNYLVCKGMHFFCKYFYLGDIVFGGGVQIIKQNLWIFIFVCNLWMNIMNISKYYWHYEEINLFFLA